MIINYKQNYIQYSNETKYNARISLYLQKTIFLFLFRSFDGKIHRCRLDNNITVTKTKGKGYTKRRHHKCSTNNECFYKDN